MDPNGITAARSDGSQTPPEDYVHVSGPDPPSPAAVTSDELDADVAAPPSSDDVDGSIQGASGSSERALPKGVMVLECESSASGGTCDVYLVGTAHVSEESCREVLEVIQCLKPQVVFLELCPSRHHVLTLQNLKVPTLSEMIDTWNKKRMNTFGILYSWFLAKIADKFEVLPGAEFRVAFEEARSYGAKVILGDRPVQITLRRTWAKMSLWHRAKFVYTLLFQSIFLPSPEEIQKMLKEMDDADMVTLLIQELGKNFPTLVETLINERDMFMSKKLLNIASKHSSVVAVVGKGHLPGIKKHWKQPIEVQDLLEIPVSSPVRFRTKTLTSVGVVAAGIAIAYGLYLVGKR